MKIANVRLRHVEGQLDTEGEFWEERLVRPIDIYPEHKAESGADFHQSRNSNGVYEVEAVFVNIETDEGLTGMFGPLAIEDAFFIDRMITPLILGEDPTATERIWDKMYRFFRHARKGNPMFAISCIDCALWDLRGKWLGQPVFRLLGGPVRDSVPAYASALGYSIEPDKAAARVKEFVAQGYTATKWFFRNAPDDGEAGARKNVELVRTVREAAGDDVDIMFDAWSSWNVRYALDMANRIAEYRPRWLEEPVMPDQIRNYARIRAASPIPISGGEHEYTRWGARDYLRAGAVDVYQADTFWAGGISEMVKIFTLASAYDIPVIPHGHSVPANAHLALATTVSVTPLLEYLVKWNEVHQFFFKNPVKPVDGMVTVGEEPGIGVEIDDSKVMAEKDLSWT
ncbi:MAG: mandelate racemase/muconate lactonizing protein [Chloroflexi bacterium]|nr:mandelate racemase/muconate lactonizing protein [Chloroflexota bacterium]MCY3937645.1 mandelate racemase/muconate lactonizing protein [Chloroflexota bacterium]